LHTNPITNTLLLVVLLLGACAASAQEESPFIRAMEVRGNRIYDDQYVFERVSSRVGQRLNLDAVAADIERLFDQGVFDDVTFLTEPYEDGVKLVIEVVERETIGVVSYIGVEDLDEDDVAEAIESRVKSGQPLDPSRLNEVVLVIKDLADEEGLIRCRVTPETSPGSGGTVDVKFVIEEGSEIWINTIEFEGNSAYSDWEIRNLFMELSEDEWWNSETFDQKIFESDREAIVDGYNNGGFLNARVEDYELNFSDTEDEVDILITVYEGERYYFGGVTWEGNNILSDRRIERSLQLAPGDVLDIGAYNATLDAIRDDYWEYGYVFLEIDEQREIDEETNTAFFTWTFDEGEPATIGRLDIVGNTYTKDKVIRREFTIYPGEVFNGKAFRRSLERIFNLQYFENIIPDWRIDPVAKVIDLTVRVVEREGTTRISVGGGYSTRDGLMANFAIGWINFDAEALPEIWEAKGGGQELTLSADLGANVSNLSISFLEPWFMDTHTAVGVGVYHSTVQTSFDYEQVKFGFYGLVGRPLGEDANWRLRYDYAENTINPDEDASESTVEAAGTTLTSSVTLALSRDTRNNYFFPTTGSRQYMSFELAGGVFGGDQDFYKITGYATAYFPGFWKTALAMKLYAGFVDAYADTERVPLYERYYTGGLDVRGYHDFSLSPRDSDGDIVGGNFKLYNQLEYRVPIVENMVYGMLFLDSGNTWAKLSEVDWGDLAFGYGLGVRIDIPMVGLLGFDYGWSSDVPKGRLHFSIAQTF
jgi:outer membrane protein insertion porin family